MIDDIWNTLNPRNTILFLGSGFSMEATNKQGEYFLDGKSLANKLGEGLEYGASTDLTLRDVSDDYVPNRLADLNQLLQPLMTTMRISDDQKEIIRQPWRRIYTTNYDDVFEFGQIAEGRPLDPVSFSDDVRKSKTGIQVVHLHGYIHKCTDENVDEELVLTERSYVRQLAFPRPWFDEFVDDIRFCQSVVFLGYSLADTPINALLVRSPEIAKKTTFIVRSAPDQRYERQVSIYGSIRPIALAGFAAHMKALAAIPRPPHNTRLAAFSEMSPGKDKKSLIPATIVEVRNLLTFGTFKPIACAASWPKPEYVIPRFSKINEAISALGQAKTIILHSRTGNGKTVFSEMLSIALSEKGWRCIRAKSAPTLNDDDLRILGSTQRVVLFFRNLDDATQTMKQLSNPRPDVRFVVEVPTAIADVRANALSRDLAKPFHRIDLNEMSSADIADFENILKMAGIRPKDFVATFEKCVELRDFLLRLYENTTIRSALMNHAKPLWNVPSVRRVMTTSFVLKCLDLDISPTMKRDIIGEDPAAALESISSALRGNAHDLFEFTDASVEPFSSVVSEVLLDELVTPDDILEWVLRVAVISGRRKQEELDKNEYGPRFTEAKKVLGGVLNLSGLRRLLKKYPSCDDQIGLMYEKARRFPEINSEPLFWLQLAILLDDPKGPLANLEQALEHMDAAYQRGEALPKFRPYQLETYHLRLLLHIETHPDSKGVPIKHWQAIIKLLERFALMLGDASHRGFAVAVLAIFEAFVMARAADMLPDQKREITTRLQANADALDRLPMEFKLSSCSETTRESLSRTINRLGRHD